MLKREPHEENARWLVDQVEKGHLDGLLGSTTFTTIYYVAGKAVGEEKTRHDLRGLLRLFEIATVGRTALEEAFNVNFEDYEDAVLHEAARHAGAEAIVTRNAPDFGNATLEVFTPGALRGALTGAG